MKTRNLLPLVGVLVHGLVCAVGAEAIDERSLHYQTSPQTGKVISIRNMAATRSPANLRRVARAASVLSPSVRRFSGGTQAASASVSDVEQLSHAFGVAKPTEELKLLSSHVDTEGIAHERYRQVVRGVPVLGGELMAHRNERGELTSMSGKFLATFGVEAQPKLLPSRAAKIARRNVERRGPYSRMHKRALIEVRRLCKRNATSTPRCFVKGKRSVSKSLLASTPKLLLRNEGFLRGDKDTKTLLVYELRFSLETIPYAETVLIDAHTKKIVKRELARQGMHREIWDCSDPFDSDQCWLGAWNSRYQYEFGREEGDPVRGPNPMPPPFLGTSDVDYLYDLVPQIETYYATKFDRNGGNGRGGFGDGVSASYSTTRVFANLNGISSLSSICDPLSGYFSAGPPASLVFCVSSPQLHDLFGHEYGHVISYFLNWNADNTFNSLSFEGESGALNEHFSDLMGESFERHMTGTNDWILFNDPNSSFVRPIADPTSVLSTLPENPPLPYPDRFHSPNYYCGDLDAGGIHHNSTVPSKAAYLASQGGTFNGCTIRGIGFDKVEQIWYRAVTQYFTTGETFNMAYNSLRNACDDLYSPADCEELTKALQAVELDQPGACSGLPALPPACGGTCLLTSSIAAI